MAELPTEVEAFIAGEGLAPRGAQVLVAVSGGLDSTTLLHLLHQLSARWRWKLHVAHFNHRLRGAAGGQDQRWVGRLARQLGCPITVGQGDVRGLAIGQGISLEMAARQLRHRFLAETARQHRIRYVALGHHADDQVELFFLRFLRGAGPQGLAGMRPSSPSPADRRVRLIRPLLGTTRSALREEALRQGWTWREDASNQLADILRNRIRHRLMPLLRRDFQPALTEVVLRSMELLRDETDWAQCAPLPTGPFAQWPIAAQRRRVQQQLHALGFRSEFRQIERLRRNPGRVWSLGPGHAIRMDPEGGIECVAKCSPSFDARSLAATLEGSSGQVDWAGLRLEWRFRRWSGATEWPKTGQSGCEAFDADRVGPNVRFRFWQPGDRFQPLGRTEPSKLQDLFVSAKVPREERHRRIVAETAAGQVFWVQGLPPGDRYRVRRTTRRVLIWRWR